MQSALVTGAAGFIGFYVARRLLADCGAVREFLPMQPGDVLETCADSSDLERTVGFRPRTSIEDGTHRFVEWFQTYRRSHVLKSAQES
jgi:nucleoside-diphosphate-sugar epimerase